MKYWQVVLIVFCLIQLGCSDEGDNIDNEEQFCSSATGTWEVSSLTCNGVAATSYEGGLEFTSSEALIQRVGNVDCVAITRFDLGFSANGSSSIEMTGSGNLSCESGGETVSRCESSFINCDSSHQAVTSNNFDQCVLSENQTITLTRLASPDLVSSQASQCSEGETEIISLRQQPSEPQALLSISDGPIYDYGVRPLGTTTTHTFVLTNIGDAPSTGLIETNLEAPFHFSGDSYPGTGGTCTTLLTNGESCTIVVDFRPTSVGEFSGEIDFEFDDGIEIGSVSRALVGESATGGGAAALLTISEVDPYHFGTVAIGATGAHSFVISNTGSVAATSLMEIGLGDQFGFYNGSYPGSGGTCTGTLNPGANCAIVIGFSPMGSGVQNDGIVISYNDGTFDQSVVRDVTGHGAFPAALVISEDPLYNFGSVTTSGALSKKFVVLNNGGVTAKFMNEIGVSTPFGFTGGSYPGTTGSCNANLLPGNTCEIELEFSPFVPGVFQDTIELEYNSGVTINTATRDVEGTGT